MIRRPHVVAAALIGLTSACSAQQGGSAAIRPVTDADLLAPQAQEWLTYHGDYSGRHHSALTQITPANVSGLKRVWVSQQDKVASRTFLDKVAGRLSSGRLFGDRQPGAGAAGPIPRRRPPGATATARSGQLIEDMSGYISGIKSGPLVCGNVMYFTVGAHAFAIDARSGRQIWHYKGKRSGGLSNRGMAIKDDAVFYMADGGLTSLDATTGALLWRVKLDGPVAASAPVVVRNHVFVAIGSDGGSGRSWLESRNANTGKREWIWYAAPDKGEPGSETWPDETAALNAAGTPWQPVTYDPALNLIYLGTGNPWPLRDGRSRPGDNLWTSSVVALNPDTGKMAWYFQMTPHDDHDYDGDQVTILFDREVGGQPRKLLGLVGRNGYIFVLDRQTGDNLATRKFLETANWAVPDLRSNGTPEPDKNKAPSQGGALVSPGSDGATNYPAPAYNPRTQLIYSNTVKSWSLFYEGGTNEYMVGDFRNALRAFDSATGKEKWAHHYRTASGFLAGYPGVLSTQAGLIFTGDPSGNLVAFDADSGKVLWHDELPFVVSNAPETYFVGGRQYIVVGSGPNLYAYALTK
jgi:alcohol dehydrogenase (cytochrome c)